MHCLLQLQLHEAEQQALLLDKLGHKHLHSMEQQDNNNIPDDTAIAHTKPLHMQSVAGTKSEPSRKVIFLHKLSCMQTTSSAYASILLYMT